MAVFALGDGPLTRLPTACPGGKREGTTRLQGVSASSSRRRAVIVALAANHKRETKQSYIAMSTRHKQSSSLLAKPRTCSTISLRPCEVGGGHVAALHLEALRLSLIRQVLDRGVLPPQHAHAHAGSPAHVSYERVPSMRRTACT